MGAGKDTSDDRRLPVGSSGGRQGVLDAAAEAGEPATYLDAKAHAVLALCAADPPAYILQGAHPKLVSKLYQGLDATAVEIQAFVNRRVPPPPPPPPLLLAPSSCRPGQAPTPLQRQPGHSTECEVT